MTNTNIIRLKKLFIFFLCFLFTLPAWAGFCTDTCSFRVKRVLTPIGKPELAQVLRNGHFAVFGHFPSEKRLATAWAQVAIENRQGLEVYNHNLGNINSGKLRPYYVKRNRFKAHRDFHDGAKDYWRIIRNMCSSSLRYFDRGQPYRAAQGLSACGYYGANKHKYGLAMMALYKTAMWEAISKL